MKLLVLLSRVPFPLEKGDKLRAYHQIRYLSEHCEVHLCCLSDRPVPVGAFEALSPFCSSIEFIRLSKVGIFWNVIKAMFSGLPLQIGYFKSSKALRIIKQRIAAVQPDHIYCQLIRMAEYIKDEPCHKTLDYQDVFSLGYERQAADNPWYLKPVYRREARLLRKYERMIFEKFDHRTIISLPDRNEIDHPRKEEIVIIHNGVDHDYYKASASIKDIDILFTGNMNYPPNVMGAETLVHAILPLVQRTYPGAKVMLAGANPSKRVRSLASERVTVTGWVDDIRSCYSRSKVFIAPMAIGTGLQNKLLEAMAMGLPCVTSALSNAALDAKPGEEILVCDTPESFADCIIRLLKDEDLSKKIALNGNQFVRQHYDWGTEVAKLITLMQSKP